MKDKIVEIMNMIRGYRNLPHGDISKRRLEEIEAMITHFYSAGEEVYVECNKKEAEIFATCHWSGKEYWLKKLTHHPVSEEEIKKAAYDIFMKALPNDRFKNINAEGYAEEVVELLIPNK
jgi:hypothetical protein